MAFRHRAGLVVLLLFSGVVWADTLDINPQHPDQYTVTQDDTLWDISAKFLKSPWQWRKLWQGNPQIKNPDLIYPGDTLVFSVVGGQPRLQHSSKGRHVQKLHPSIRQTPLDTAIKMIPSDAIAQFLNSPRVVSATELEKSPYVVGFPEEHLIAGAGNRVYVRSILQPETLNYTFYRKGSAYIQPETGEILGYEAVHVANATLQKEGDPATLLITQSKQELRIGDRLMPSSENQTALNFFPSSPEIDINGNIINVLNGVSQIGRYDIVVVDKGAADGLKVGHVLAIYQRGKIIQDRLQVPGSITEVKLPNEMAGNLLIFRIFDRVSYALVVEATQAIHVFDKIKTP